VEHEARMRVEHGRRSAQKDAYIAAGGGPSFSQHVGATRRPPSKEFSGGHTAAAGGSTDASLPFGSTSDWSQMPARAPMRAVPAGRGLSREGGSRDAAAAASALGSQSALGSSFGPGGDAFNLSGMSLSASMIQPGERPAVQPVQQRRGAAPSPPQPDDDDAALSRAVVDVADMAASFVSVGGDSPGRAGGATRMTRAREWSAEVENQYRLQEAGYRDETDALALGHPPVERWPDGGLIRKLITRETLGKEASSTLYFSKKRECEDKDINKVKLYAYD